MSSQNLASTMVSVTKLCCPVCWELFQVLKMGNAIHGCHPNVTLVVLPKMLPISVSNAMVDRFRTHLSNQLHHLLSPNTVTSGHHRNFSDSGYSATSSNEGALEDTDSHALKNVHPGPLAKEYTEEADMWKTMSQAHKVQP
jgi:hypothetical protein